MSEPSEEDRERIQQAVRDVIFVLSSVTEIEKILQRIKDEATKRIQKIGRYA